MFTFLHAAFCRARRIAAFFVLSTAISSPAMALVTFQSNTPAKAAEVNANFSELSGRIDSLEAASTAVSTNVDCTAAANALQNAVADAPSGSELIVTGTCVGPVSIKRNGIKVRANTPGTDGIFADGIDRPVLKITGDRITIEGLLISIVGGTDDSIGVSVAEGGSATIDNLHVSGSFDHLLAQRLGTLTLRNTTDIAFLVATDGGQIRIEGGNGGFQIVSKRGGSVNVRSEASGSTFDGVTVRDGSTFQVGRGATSITINGKLEVLRSSNALFRSPVTVNFTDGQNPGVVVFQNGSLQLLDATINTITDIAGAAVLRACGTDFNDPNTATPNDGLILVDVASALVLQPCDGPPIDPSSAGAIEVDANSSAAIIGSTLNGYNDGGETYAIDLAAGGQVNLEDSTVNDRAFISVGGIVEMEGTTMTGDLFAQGNSVVLLESGSSIAATRAENGNCPSSFEEGIRLSAGSSLIINDQSSSISGYLERDKTTIFQAYPISTFGGIVDVGADMASLDSFGFMATTNGINSCMGPMP